MKVPVRAGVLGSVLTVLILTASCEHIFDFKPPKVWFVTPTAGETVFSPTAVELRVDDEHFRSLVLYVDDAETKTYNTDSISDSLVLSEGAHTLRVRAHDKGGNHSDATITVTARVLGLPTLRTPTNGSVLSETRPRFSWTYPYAVQEFQLQADNNSDFSSPIVDQSLSDSSFTPTVPLEEGAYCWRVRARVNATRWSPWTSKWTFAVATQGLPPPGLYLPINGDTTGDATPYFDWSDVSGAVKYWLQVDNDAFFLSPAIDDSTLTVSEYTPTQNLADGDYHWRVRSQSASSYWGGWSLIWDFTVNQVGVPALLQPPDSALVTESRPEFTWSMVSGVEMYWLEVDDDQGFSSPAISDSTTDTTYAPGSALADGKYYWRVRAGSGEGLWSGWSGVRTFSLSTQGPPSPPTLLEPTNGATITDNTPSFDWNDPAGAARFRLQVDDSSDFSSPVVDDSEITVSAHTPAESLADGKYHWRVCAANAIAQWSQWSSSWDFTLLTIGTPTPLAPADGAIFWHSESVELSWSNVANATLYEVQVDNDSGFASPHVVDTVVSDTDCMWTPGTQRGRLYWRVRAGVDSILGAWSSTRLFEAVPYQLGSYASPGDERDVSVAGSYAGLADCYYNFRLVDVSNPSNPAELGFCDLQFNALSVALRDTFAFIGELFRNFTVVSIGEPDSPRQVASIGLPYDGPVTDVRVTGSNAYATNTFYLYIINVSDPVHPFVAGQTSFIHANAVGVVGSTAYVACDSGLYVFDVTDPANPTQVRYLSLPDTGLAVHCLNSFVYVADNRKGLYVYDASDPHSPSLVGSYDTPGTARGVQACGPYVYVADGGGGLRVIDVNSPSSPREVGFFDSGDAQSVQVIGSYAYVANSPGLLVLKVKPE